MELGLYAISASLDGTWSFLDLERGSTLCNIEAYPNAATPIPLLCGMFHPDGVILATGTESSELKIWDIREQTNVANCGEHTGPVVSVAFSENGFILATGSQDGNVRVWDLRKLKCIRTISCELI